MCSNTFNNKPRHWTNSDTSKILKEMIDDKGVTRGASKTKNDMQRISNPTINHRKFEKINTLIQIRDYSFHEIRARPQFWTLFSAS